MTARRLGRIAEWTLALGLLALPFASKARAEADCPPGTTCPNQAPAAARPPLARVAGDVQPWYCVVRVEVDQADGKTISIGCGTVIDGRRQAGRVLTCAHVFSEAPPRPRARLATFDGARRGGRLKETGVIEGWLVAIDAARDVAVIAFVADEDLPAAPLAPAGYEPPEGLACITMGCDTDPPSAWTTIIVGEAAVKGRDGLRWLAGDREAKHGRSGGGLFRASDGVLIGVCDFGGGGRGYYAHPASLRAVVDSVPTSSGSPPSRPETPQAIVVPPAARGFDAWHALLGSGFGITLVALSVAKVKAFLASRAPRLAAAVGVAPPTSPAPAVAPGTPAEMIAQLLPHLRTMAATEEDKRTRVEQDRALAEQIAALIRPTGAAPAAA
jgi:S1-C subfamily serine protease